MPRNGSGVYSLPAGSTATTGTTALATTHNTPLVDIVSDLNAARPVVAGGTGGTTAHVARVNLQVGAFFETRAALAAATMHADTDFVATGGYATAGDNGGAFYKRAGSEPSHPGKVQSADGAWWELVAPDGAIRPEQFAAAVGSDASDEIQDAIDFLEAAGGGVLDLAQRTWLLNDANVRIDGDHVFIVNGELKRTSATTGFMVAWAQNSATDGGGLMTVRLTGVATTTGGNGGVLFGTSGGTKADKAICTDVTASSWSQYGIGFKAGDNALFHKCRVLEHGLSSGTIAAMGFFIFPETDSVGVRVVDLHSEISAACQANGSATTAAIKFQCAQKFHASQITAVAGSESCFVIDSIQGVISDVDVYPESTSDVGFSPGNFNAAHSYSGQVFTASDIRIHGASGFAMSFGNPGDGNYKLTGCRLSGIYCPDGIANFLHYASYKDCVFENWTFADIRMEYALSGATANSAPPTNSVLRNIVATGNGKTGRCSFDINDSTLIGVGVSAVDGDTASSIEVTGDGNIVQAPFSNGSSTHAMQIDGDGNRINDFTILNQTSGNSVIFSAGSSSNIARGGNLDAGSGVLDSGDNLYDGQTFTTTEIEDAAALVNTLDKRAGKQIWNATTGRPVWADGDGATDTWSGADGAAVHTPV